MHKIVYAPGMGLSRLSQLLSNTTGRTLYVNPDSIDATDSIENRGNSPTRPFYGLNRAIAEAVRFSYQIGPNNDRFARCTISLSPGIHRVTNRPGWIPDGANNFRLRNGTTSSDFSQWDNNTNFDITTSNNALYKLNSIHGGIFLPRGVSIIGQDYQKTIIVPDYVPNPTNDFIERCAVFLLTGQNFINELTIDDPTDSIYYDYTTNKVAPTFSQHKLTDFEMADGVNVVAINDGIINYTSTRTDLQMYYEKIGLVFGSSSGREIQPDYPSTSIDIQPRIDEYRIVGSLGKEVNLSSIQAGDGITATISITATLSQPVSELDVNTPIQIQGVPATGYDGQYIVKQVLSPTQIVYEVATPPANAAPSLSAVNATLNISVDTITSSSPYLLNIANKTVWGRSGLHVDGSKVSGFKTVVVDKFTGIGLQKDPLAFVKYNSTSGIFEDSSATGNENIQTSSRAKYKPTYENFYIKSSNDASIYAASIFAIGYANQFISESGSIQLIKSSTSTFGAKALVSKGFKENALIQDDVGYITHIIPPKELGNTESLLTYEPIDALVTKAVGNSSRLYIYNKTVQSNPPVSIVDGFRIGAKANDELQVVINSTKYSAKILIPNGSSSSEKVFKVERISNINSITSNTITLTQNHTFTNGETVRVISDTAQLPDGILNNNIYYVITTGNSNQIKLARTLADAVVNSAININNRGGTLSIVSRVSDKVAGEIGHPLQFDVSNGWYITVDSSNTIYPALNSITQRETPKTYLTRKFDNRSLSDTIYKVRYVIPSSLTYVNPPREGYVFQESSSTIGKTNSEIAAEFNPNTNTLGSSAQVRNQKLISNATWLSNTATIYCEKPHNLVPGSIVKIKNVRSTNNLTGTDNLGYNGRFTVESVINRRSFGISLLANPGTFTNNTSTRTTTLPYFTKNKTKTTFYIYGVEEVKKHVPGSQDGVYYLTILHSSNNPTLDPFTTNSYSQPIQNLYPQKNRDNPVADPKETTCYALPDPLGQVVVNEPQYSITREAIQKTFIEQNIGIAITNIVSNNAGTAHTIYSLIDHGLNPITSFSITTPGAGYGSGLGSQEVYYNAQLVNVSSSGENATARVTVSAAGAISAIQIMDGGSNYNVGDRLNVVGIATTTGHVVGVVSVSTIYNHVGETLKINKISDSYDTSYRITGITSSRTINVSSASSITNTSIVSTQGYAEFTGRLINVSATTQTSDVVTVTTTSPHDLFTGNKVLFSGFSSSFFNNTFTVANIVGLNTFTVSTGKTNVSASFSGTPYVFRQGASSNGGTQTKENENLRGRTSHFYAGITTTLTTSVNSTATTLTISNAINVGLKLGDYLLIDEEIVRVSTTITSDSVTVFRGVFGTRGTSHNGNAYVYKVNPLPIEFRKNSLISATSHTFENNGYGSGNYSAAIPDKHNRTLSKQEELLAKSTKEDGGIIVFSGSNSDGQLYIGNKKVNQVSKTQEVFDGPVATITGEDLNANKFADGYDNLTTQDATISQSLFVEGGTNKELISQFDGPVILNKKLTLNSLDNQDSTILVVNGDAKLNTINSGNIISTGIISATNFVGNLSGTANLTSLNVSGNITGIASTAINLTRAENILDGIINPARLAGTYNIDISGTSNLAAISETDTNASYYPLFVSNTGSQELKIDLDRKLSYNPATNRLGVGTSIPTKELDVRGDVVAQKYFGDGINLVGIVTQLIPSIGVNIRSSQNPGKGVVIIDAYKPVGKTIYVSQNGDDNNTGLTENYPKRTIKSASSIALVGDTIKVYPGVYVEENPIYLAKTVSIQGTELRNIVITPKYPEFDLFYVNNGCHLTNASFIGPEMGNGSAVVSLQPLLGVSTDRYFDAARMIRMNLDYIASESVGFLTSGFSGFAGGHREQDAARLIDKNLNYISAEAVGFLTTPIGSGGYGFTLSGGDYVNCREDVVNVFSAVSYDLKANSNRKSVGAALSYFNSSGGLIHITGISTQQATIAAFNYAVGIAKSVINNVNPPVSYQSGIGSVAQVIDLSVIATPGGCVGVGNSISQLVGIVTSAIGAGNTSGLPAIKYGVTLESQNCADDIKDIWKCIIYDITRGGNSRSYQAGSAYYDGNWNLLPGILKNPGEVQQTIKTIIYSFDIARDVVNNSSWGGYPVGIATSVTNAFYNNVTGVATITAPNHGLSLNSPVKIVGLGFTCPSGIQTLTYPTGKYGYIFPVKNVINSNSFEVVVGTSTLPHTYVSGGTIQKYTNFQNSYTQVKDLSIQPDPLTGFNNSINSCSDVISALHSCVGVVTTVIGLGNSSGIIRRFPGNSGIGFTTLCGITSAIYYHSTDLNNPLLSGFVRLTCPGLNVKIGDRIELRELLFQCSSSGSGISTQFFPSGKFGYEFYVDKINSDSSFNVFVGISSIPHTYVGGGFIVNRSIGVTTATYNHITGITTITAPGVFVKPGDVIKIRDLQFACSSGAATTTIYPTGNQGYDFRVLSVPSLGNSFTVRVGTSTIPHNYVSGGVVFPPYSKGVGPITQGPYIRNCTNFIPKSIGMKVDGFHAEPGDQNDIGVTGSMSVDSYTQYNQGGIGVSITNGGYAQLVSIFTICNDIAIYTSSGGQCDLTNSNSSFGNYGLYSSGVGDNESKSIYRYTGEVKTTVDVNDLRNDIITISGIGDNRPYDGQAIYFDKLFYRVDRIEVTNGGSGYSETSPPEVVIDFPTGPNGIRAEASANVSNGKVTSIDIISTGNQYESIPNISFVGVGTGATATATTVPIYYNIESATKPVNGETTVVLTTPLNNTVTAGTTVYFFRLSLQIATTISFEWVGAGTDINTAKPALGGVTISDNEVFKELGGQVIYTSTNQSGNFKIGDEVVINQLTGTISGRAYNQSVLTNVTPFILALG